MKKLIALSFAGGYDQRVSENVVYHKELCALADSLELRHATAKTVVSALAVPSDIDVLFLLSVPNSFKRSLLSSANLLIYTPRNEHFGIVPLEAMLAGVPVLAANEGGPRETVLDGKTGWLRDVNKVGDWTAIIQSVITGAIPSERLHSMGQEGKNRVREVFSKAKMASRFESEIDDIMKVNKPSVVTQNLWLLGLVIVGSLAGLSYPLLVR